MGKKKKKMRGREKVNLRFCYSNLPYICLRLEENEIERIRKKKRGRRRSRGSPGRRRGG